jgi:hypothetical protein
MPPGSPLLQTWFWLIAAAIVVAAGALVRQVAPERFVRFMAAAIGWIAVVSAASYSGVLVPVQRPPVPFLVLFLSIVTLGVTLARSQVGERLARGLPLTVLVGFQGFRLPLELAMHQAYAEGLMPVQMSYSGRNLDILTGISALLLAAALQFMRVPLWVVRAWNWLGLALLVNIVAVAMMSTPLIAYFGPDRVNVFVFGMPYTLLPAVMVLAAWAGHLIVFRALNLRAASTPDPR